ncbi:heterokaryon incompatibility protein-domain-containing protein [Apiospora arundinis]
MKNSKQPSLSGNLGAGTTKKPVLRQHGDIINTKLKLVLGSEVQKEASDRYVTLSHCWGNPQQEGYVTPPRLTREMLSTYCREGVRIGDLTLTFRQAIEFAARITSVRYIWIDSLCIVQSDMEEWIRESREMFHVYSESYLNISATASSNSNGGLYRHRQRTHLWEDEVSLNIAGLPGARVASRGTTRSAELLLQPGHDAGIMKREGVSLERSETDPGCLFSIYHGLWRQIPSRRKESSKSLKRQERLVPTGVQASPTNPSHAFPAQGGSLRRCVLIEASRWEKLVNAAPVNTRGWVLQERLMAPRVLHFCSDQIAWECKRCDLYESQARGVPNFQLKYDEIVPDERVKALELEDGRLLRNQRLQGALDPDEALEHVYAFEIWARIVEMYSRAAITKPEDKLIALSGIAQMMADKMTDPKDGSTPTYIAGLWGETSSHFENLGQRSPIYRAPSFSWAALDAHKGTGIIYGEVTDKDLLIRADERSISIQPSDEHNPFGAKTDRMGKPTGRFGWLPKDKKNTDDKEHTNVYLDCPGSDAECSGIIEKTDTYHLPVAMGPRTARFESKYIFCLLLQEVRERVDGLLGHGAKTLRRVGLSKLSPWGDRRAYEHITKSYGIFEDGVTGEIGKTSMVPRRYGQWDLDSGSEEFYLV